MKKDLYIEIDNIFNTKLDMECYANFKEVYFDLLYNKLGVLKTSLINIIKFNNTLLYADMQRRLSFDPDLEYIRFIGKLILIQNNIISHPICHCGKLIKYSNRNDGMYNLGCSHSCRTSLPSIVAKRKQTNLEHHGVENPFQSKEVQGKIKQTNIDRLGVENPQQSKAVQEKTKQTNLQRRGVEYPGQSKGVQEKMKQTNLERRGVEWCLQSKQVQEKSKQTNLERRGVEHPMQSKEIQEKAKQTNLERRQVEYPGQSKDVQEKTKQTNFNRLGVEHSMQSKQVQEKSKQTNLERRGVKNPMQSKEVQEKAKQTNLERRQVEYPWQSKEVQEKSYITFLENHIDSIWGTILSNTHCRPLFSKDDYIGSNYNSQYNWECTNCNLQYESYYYGGRVKACPICKCTRSKGEIELYNYIQSLIPDVEVIANDYSVIHPKELDIYIPSLKLAFEYNGDYWHGLKEIGYHEGKTNGCLSKGITLHHIWENSWAQNQEETKELISKILGR